MRCSWFASVLCSVVLLGCQSGGTDPVEKPEPVPEPSAEPAVTPAQVEPADANPKLQVPDTEAGDWGLYEAEDSDEPLGLLHQTEDGERTVFWIAGSEGTPAVVKATDAWIPDEFLADGGSCADLNPLCGLEIEWNLLDACYCGKGAELSRVDSFIPPTDPQRESLIQPQATNFDDGEWSISGKGDKNPWAYVYRPAVPGNSIELVVAYTTGKAGNIAAQDARGRPFTLANWNNEMKHKRAKPGMETSCAQLGPICTRLKAKLEKDHNAQGQTGAAECWWTKSTPIQRDPAKPLAGCSKEMNDKPHYAPGVYRMNWPFGILAQYEIHGGVRADSAGQELCSVDSGNSCSLKPLTTTGSITFVDQVKWDSAGTVSKTFDCSGNVPATHPDTFFQRADRLNNFAQDEYYVSSKTSNVCVN